jgi:hypothetical protein
LAPLRENSARIVVERMSLGPVMTTAFPVCGKAAVELGWSPTQRSVTHWIAKEMV